MNRKLHNSLNAAMACSALLTLAVLSGAPIEQPASAATTNVAAVSAPVGATAGATAGAAPAAAMAASSERRVTRRSYHSVRMPFFSFFLPRG